MSLEIPLGDDLSDLDSGIQLSFHNLCRHILEVVVLWVLFLGSS